jgi:hypothetical protein
MVIPIDPQQKYVIPMLMGNECSLLPLDKAQNEWEEVMPLGNFPPPLETSWGCHIDPVLYPASCLFSLYNLPATSQFQNNWPYLRLRSSLRGLWAPGPSITMLFEILIPHWIGFVALKCILKYITLHQKVNEPPFFPKTCTGVWGKNVCGGFHFVPMF